MSSSVLMWIVTKTQPVAANNVRVRTGSYSATRICATHFPLLLLPSLTGVSGALFSLSSVPPERSLSIYFLAENSPYGVINFIAFLIEFYNSTSATLLLLQATYFAMMRLRCVFQIGPPSVNNSYFVPKTLLQCCIQEKFRLRFARLQRQGMPDPPYH